MSRSWEGGSSSAWKRTRRAILADNLEHNAGRCTLQIRGVCTGAATQVHHTLGRRVTGDDPRYLVAACAACNLHVGDPMKGSPEHRIVSKW